MAKSTKLTPAAKPEPKEEEKKEPSLKEYLNSIGIITGRQLKESQDRRPSYSTNCIGLDTALGKKDPETGLPGLPARSISEWVGPNQTGKTATMDQLQLSVLNRNHDYLVALICAEEINTSRMERVGIDLDRVIPLHVFHEDINEQYRLADEAMKKALYLVSTNKRVKMVGLDSIKALCAGTQVFDVEDKKASQNNFTKQVVASRAVLMNTFIRNFRAQNNSDAFLFMTNQISVQKIEATIENNGRGPNFKVNNPSFYTPWDIQVESAGGYGIRHDADFRVETSSQPWFYKDKEDKVIMHPIHHTPVGRGLEISWRVFKNKSANKTNFRKCTARFDFEKAAFDNAQEILTYGTYLGLIEQAGAWYKFDPSDDSARTQGASSAYAYLENHPALCEKLAREIRLRGDELHDLPDSLKRTARW